MPNSPKPGPEERSLLSKVPPNSEDNPRRATWATYLVRGFLLLFAVTFSARALWYGKPTAVNCGLTNTGQIDCTLTSQALLRSWNQHIPEVTAIKVDSRGYYTENDKQEKHYVDYYAVVLQTQDREYPIKTYSYRNDPELEVWRHRINQFADSPENGLTVPVYYNPWQPVLKVILVPLYIIVLMITPVIIAFFFLSLCLCLGYRPSSNIDHL
jgi:hypothetical protein